MTVTNDTCRAPAERSVITGDLAAPRRTLAGALVMMDRLGLGRAEAERLLSDVGLPAAAYEQPDFPISQQHEETLSLLLMRRHRPASDPVSLALLVSETFHLGAIGVLGLAMQHAPSLNAAFQVGLSHPQLVWGHARVEILERPDATLLRFTMARPSLPEATPLELERLRLCGLVIDLFSLTRIIEDLLGAETSLRRIALPAPRPADWAPARAPCAVDFDAPAAELTYAADLLDRRPRDADRVAFLAYTRLAARMAEPLAAEAGLADQVTRWLWASSPPLSRGAIAERLGRSERSLARELRAEGASYNALAAKVQEERAKNLLRNPALPVASVAYRLGYSDPAAFSRAFSGWTGAAPSAWRAAQARQG